MASQLPSEMLACQVVEYNQPYQVRTVPVPTKLGPHDLLVKIAVSSFCHTDTMVRSGAFRTKLPCTGSHEGAGTVVAVGPSVKDFQLGDRVLCPVVSYLCGECPDCTGPETTRQYCHRQGGAPGITRDGMFAEYVVADSHTAASIPASISFATAAPLACAGCTVWKGIIDAALQPGDWLAIIGSGGGVGHLGIKFAKAMGLKVIGVDARDTGLELSHQAGADLVVDARKPQNELLEAIHSATELGAHATLNVSDAESAATTACLVTRKHGTVIQIAQPQTVSIPFQHIVFNDIRIHGSLMSSPQQLRDMLEFVARHNISVDTQQFHGLSEVSTLLERVESGKLAGKAVVIIDGSQVNVV
ncbi:hypothetical protein BDW75DRAFT_252122 [Aspergillus navahoensis]